MGNNHKHDDEDDVIEHAQGRHWMEVTSKAQQHRPLFTVFVCMHEGDDCGDGDINDDDDAARQ